MPWGEGATATINAAAKVAGDQHALGRYGRLTGGTTCTGIMNDGYTFVNRGDRCNGQFNGAEKDSTLTGKVGTAMASQGGANTAKVRAI